MKIMRYGIGLVSLALALSTLACGSDPPSSPSAIGVDGGTSTDTDGGSDTDWLVFNEHGPGSEASIYLKQSSLNDSRLRVELLSNDIDKLYGVAFRLHYDENVLALSAFESAAAWPHLHLAKAAQANPGHLFGVITAKGQFAGLDQPSQTLATLSFEILTVAETDVAFSESRSAVVIAEQEQSPAVQWRGGRLALCSTQAGCETK